jgi:tetratricopeptide (TPR) repeat protein
MSDSVDDVSFPAEPDPSVPPSPDAPFSPEQLEEAIVSAFQRDALATGARLSLRLGQLLYVTPRPSLVKAYQYTRLADEAAQACVSDHHTQDLTFELDRRLLLGKLGYLLEEYQQAEDHLKFVLQSTSTMTAKSRLAGDAAATLALVHRSRRDPLRSLAYCWTALPLFESLDAPNAHARLCNTAVESALDILEQRGAPQHYVDMASSHLSTALRLANRCGDPSSVGMARLAAARFSRLMDGPGVSLWIIEDVLHDAARRHDMGLLAQAHSSLGFDLMAQGFAEAALESFGRAIDTARASELLSVSGLPRRAILLRHEFGIA